MLRLRFCHEKGKIKAKGFGNEAFFLLFKPQRALGSREGTKEMNSKK